MPDSDNTIPAGFRAIPGFQRYAIDENGTILTRCGIGRHAHRVCTTWSNAKRLKPMVRKGGYHFVNLRLDGNQRKMFVHTLVLTVFVGPCPVGMECRHLDGNPANNNVSNLAWGTSLENKQDKILHGTSGLGEANSGSKLNAADVIAIRSRAASGETLEDIAKDFPVTSNNISLIVLRRTWQHI